MGEAVAAERLGCQGKDAGADAAGLKGVWRLVSHTRSLKNVPSWPAARTRPSRAVPKAGREPCRSPAPRTPRLELPEVRQRSSSARDSTTLSQQTLPPPPPPPPPPHAARAPSQPSRAASGATMAQELQAVLDAADPWAADLLLSALAAAAASYRRSTCTVPFPSPLFGDGDARDYAALLQNLQTLPPLGAPGAASRLSTQQLALVSWLLTHPRRTVAGMRRCTLRQVQEQVRVGCGLLGWCDACAVH